MSTTIRDILNAKGTAVITCDARETVRQAVTRMVEANVGAIIIMDGGSVCGIFTERDFLRNLVKDPRDPTTTAVKDISTCDIVCVGPTSTVEEAMAVMTEMHIRHLPVMEKGKLVGLVSIGDLVKQVSKDQEAKIQHLTDFISDKYPA